VVAAGRNFVQIAKEVVTTAFTVMLKKKYCAKNASPNR
jgi:hypothetical protein